MHIFKVKNSDGILTYMFMEESWGRSGNTGLGILVFVAALKKEFKDFPLRTTLTIMTDHGLYYSVTSGRYLAEISEIVLSEGRDTKE